MISYLLHFLRLFPLLFSFRNALAHQKEFAKRLLSDTIQESKKTNDGSLDDDDFTRLNLYAVAIPAMLGESYCVLRGKALTDKERISMTYLAAMTAPFDDLFDKKNLSEPYVLSLINTPTVSMDTNSNERLLIALYTLALKGSMHPDEIKSYCLSVFEAQKASKRQVNPSIQKDEIRQITQQKGGQSMLVYSCALEESLSTQERQLIYHLGAIGQLENDVFDLYKDTKEGIHTLASTAYSMEHLRAEYVEWMQKVRNAVMETKYSLSNKKAFLRIANFVMCRGLVCLGQWRKLEKRSGKFDISSYTKKELTCDMERPYNILKLMHYTAKFSKW